MFRNGSRSIDALEPLMAARRERKWTEEEREAILLILGDLAHDHRMVSEAFEYEGESYVGGPRLLREFTEDVWSADGK